MRFFLTKSQHCLGQTPREMRFEKSLHHFGVAQRAEDDLVTVSTFGEWSNRGGSASIRLFVMIPRGVKYTLDEGLHGGGSKASSKLQLGDKALSDCYWYASPRPRKG